MKKLPTVKIQNPHNPKKFVTINEADFVEGKHVPWKAEEKAASKKGEDK
jgi:hypothetical protein